MKKRLLAFALLLSLVSFSTISCASDDDLAEVFSDISTTYAERGGSRNKKISKATSKISKALEEITPEEEYYIGRAVAATVLTNYSVYEDKAKEKYLNLICNSIAINSDNPYCYNGYHVKLLDTDEINAYATSSGIIFITRGLYEVVTSEDELAAVIAHELAHIMLRHSTKAIKSSRWTEAGAVLTNTITEEFIRQSKTLAPDLADYEMLASVMNDMVEDITTQLIIKGYSKAQEFEADFQAVQLMADTKYSPDSMISMLELLNKSNSSVNSGMYSTHPSPYDRIENVSAALALIKKPADTRRLRRARFAEVNQVK